ncbi:MAG TPA: hydrogenase 4 subunit F [Candidatus Aquicultor sp.]|jgi:hydrogenase-4 component F
MNLAIALLFMPLITAALCIVVRRPTIAEKIAAAGSILTLMLGIAVAWEVSTNGNIYGNGGYIAVDQLSMLMVLLITSIGTGAILFSLSYIKEEVEHGRFNRDRVRWYYAILNFFVLAMLLAVVTDNLGMFWVAMELTTLTSALMVSFYRTRASLEAAWKYVIICSAGISFALLGTVLTYYSSLAGTTGTLNWSELMQHASRLNPVTIRLAFIFILVGYGTKAGLVPMHTWLPDAHSLAPTPVSGLLSGVLLSCAMYGIIRYDAFTVRAVGTTYPGTLLIAFGLISILTAALFMLVQKDYKRLLAYSSIEHMGIIVFALGLGSKLALYGAIFHLINHAISKSTLFFIAGRINHIFRSKQIGRIRGVIGVTPVTGSFFAAGVLAIAGAPPFGLFTSEFIILSGGFSAGKAVVSAVALLSIVIAFSGLTYYLSRITFGPRTNRPISDSRYRLPVVIFAVGLSSMALVGLYIPLWLNNLLENIARSLGGV